MGYSTYLVLIALQCLGLPLALLVSPLNKVIRPDGSRFLCQKTAKSVKGQCEKWYALLHRRQFYLLIPILVGFNWNSTYLGIFLVNYFSVRSKELASLTSGISATAANIFWGVVLRPQGSEQASTGSVYLMLHGRHHGSTVWMADCNGGRVPQRQSSRYSGLG